MNPAGVVPAAALAIPPVTLLVLELVLLWVEANGVMLLLLPLLELELELVLVLLTDIVRSPAPLAVRADTDPAGIW